MITLNNLSFIVTLNLSYRILTPFYFVLWVFLIILNDIELVSYILFNILSLQVSQLCSWLFLWNLLLRQVLFVCVLWNFRQKRSWRLCLCVFLNDLVVSFWWRTDMKRRLIILRMLRLSKLGQPCLPLLYLTVLFSWRRIVLFLPLNDRRLNP